MIELETTRLKLRPLEMQDAQRLTELVDEDVAANTLSFMYPFPLEAAQERIQKLMDAAAEDFAYSFAVFLKSDGVMVGNAGIFRETDNPEKEAGIGYFVGREFRGHGYATEATKRIIQFGFEQMGVDQISACYFTFNPASRRVMENAGMQFDKFCSTEKNGENIDSGWCKIDRLTYRSIIT